MIFAGAWAAETARLAGLTLPLCALKHSYVVSESLPAIQGLPNIRDGDSSIYIRIYKDNMFVGGFEKNPVILEEVGNEIVGCLDHLFCHSVESENILNWKTYQ